jgi:carbon-monoxide dehydrogenase medium subunit
MNDDRSVMRPAAAMHRPEDLDHLLDLLREHGDTAKIVAGGTAFTILWKAGLLQAGHVVSVTGLPGLDEVRCDDAELSIGALARVRDVERTDTTRAASPVLASTLRLVANARVRNVATMGGNVAEADYTSDPPAVLSALDAVVTIRSKDGARDLPLREFLVDYFQTALEPDEFVTGVRVPVLGPEWSGSYLKLLSRAAEDRTCIGVAAFLRRGHDGACTGARVSVVGGNPVPLRLPDVERSLVGQEPSVESFAALAAEYAAAADPVEDNRGTSSYRRRVMAPLIVRALRRAARGTNDAVFA